MKHSKLLSKQKYIKEKATVAKRDGGFLYVGMCEITIPCLACKHRVPER